MHSVTQVSCLSGDQRVRRKFFVNQCYLWCGHKSYRRSLHWANTHSLTGDLEEYFPGEKTGLRKIDSSFFCVFFCIMPQCHPWGWALIERWTRTTRTWQGQKHVDFLDVALPANSTSYAKRICLLIESLLMFMSFFFPIAPPSFFFLPFIVRLIVYLLTFRAPMSWWGLGRCKLFPLSSWKDQSLPPQWSFTVIFHHNQTEVAQHSAYTWRPDAGSNRQPAKGYQLPLN